MAGEAEASPQVICPHFVFDPGIEEDSENWWYNIYSTLKLLVSDSCMVRKGLIRSESNFIELSKFTLDTGASNGNYIGYQVLLRLDISNLKVRECYHKVRLGDGMTELIIEEKVSLKVQLYDDKDSLTDVTKTDFYIAWAMKQ